MSSITLVTGYYNLSSKLNTIATMETYMKNGEFVLSQNSYLVVFGDDDTIPLISNIREKYGFLDKTYFINKKLETFETWRWYDRIEKNREKYWPTRDSRAPTTNHLINCSKSLMVLKAMKKNPFQTTHFGWMDFGIGKLIPEKQKNSDFVMDQITKRINKTNKFVIMQMNYSPLTELKEYYSSYKFCFTGCFWMGSLDVLKVILNKHFECFIEHTIMGFGHADELIFPFVVREHEDLFDFNYGDYQDIFSNMNSLNTNLNYILHYVFLRLVNGRAYNQAYRCGKELMKILEKFDLTSQMTFYFFFYMCCYYSNLQEETKTSVTNIKQLCEMNPNHPFNLENLVTNTDFALNLFHPNKKISKCATLPKTLEKDVVYMVHDKYSSKSFCCNEIMFRPIPLAERDIKVLVLVIANDDGHYLELQRHWRKYQKSHSNTDVYFLKCDKNADQSYVKDDSFYCNCEESMKTGVLTKTIRAFEHFANQYDFIYRTNLSTFLLLDRLYKSIDKFSTKLCKANLSRWGNEFDYPSGSGFLISNDVCNMIVQNKHLINYSNWDDVEIGKLLIKLGIPVQNCERFDIYNGDENIDHIPSTTYQIRVKLQNRENEHKFHELLFDKFYH